MEELIEELTKVNPANLSEQGLKLFNKINEIIDKNRELEDNQCCMTVCIRKDKEKLFFENKVKALEERN